MVGMSIEQQLIAITQDVLKERGICTTFEMQDSLNEEGLGLDSISRLSLLAKVESHFEMEFPEEYWGSKTFTNLKAIEYFVSQRNGS